MLHRNNFFNLIFLTPSGIVVAPLGDMHPYLSDPTALDSCCLVPVSAINGSGSPHSGQLAECTKICFWQTWHSASRSVPHLGQVDARLEKLCPQLSQLIRSDDGIVTWGGFDQGGDSSPILTGSTSPSLTLSVSGFDLAEGSFPSSFSIISHFVKSPIRDLSVGGDVGDNFSFSNFDLYTSDP